LCSKNFEVGFQKPNKKKKKKKKRERAGFSKWHMTVIQEEMRKKAEAEHTTACNQNSEPSANKVLCRCSH
jgi:hypothetical protein